MTYKIEWEKCKNQGKNPSFKNEWYDRKAEHDKKFDDNEGKYYWYALYAAIILLAHGLFGLALINFGIIEDVHSQVNQISMAATVVGGLLIIIFGILISVMKKELTPRGDEVECKDA